MSLWGGFGSLKLKTEFHVRQSGRMSKAKTHICFDATLSLIRRDRRCTVDQHALGVAEANNKIMQ